MTLSTAHKYFDDMGKEVTAEIMDLLKENEELRGE